VQDIVKQAVGFTPAEIADRFQRNTFQRNEQRRIGAERTMALRGAARARVSGEGADEAQTSVDRFNERFPEKPIRQKSIMQSVRRMNARGDRMEFGVDLDPKLGPGIKNRTAPSIYSRE
jgi:hypothetical protein